MLDTSRDRKGQVLLEIQETERLILTIEKELTYLGELHQDFSRKVLYSPKELWKPGQETHNVSVLQYDVRKIPDLQNVDRVFELTDMLRQAANALRLLNEEKSALKLY